MTQWESSVKNRTYLESQYKNVKKYEKQCPKLATLNNSESQKDPHHTLQQMCY